MTTASILRAAAAYLRQQVPDETDPAHQRQLLQAIESLLRRAVRIEKEEGL